MKKLFFALPLAALLAAGCNSSQQAPNQTPVQTPVVQNTNPAPTPTPNTPTPVPITDATPSPTATSTNPNTKIYTNDNGYQFVYSSDFTLSASNPQKVALQATTNTSKRPDLLIEYFNSLTQLPHYQPGMNTIDDYLSQSGNAKLVYNVTSGKRNGNLVYMFTDAGLAAVYTELMPHNNHFYQISFNMRETGAQLTANENQILTTFKFTK